MRETGNERAPWLGRTDQILDRSRFVLGVLTICALLFSAPHMIRISGDDRPGIIVVVLLLLATIPYCYRIRRVPPPIEVLEAACLCTAMAALPTPLTALTFLFPLLWCRGLYGGRIRVLVRSSLHMAAMLLSVPFSAVLVQPVDPDLTTFLTVGLASIVFINVAGRQLAVGMRSHDDGSRRERLISASGTRLLGVTDRDSIRQISREAMLEVAADLPDLRVIGLYRVGDRVKAASLVGTFDHLPEQFSAGELGLAEEYQLSAVVPHAVPVLDRAVGRQCQWAVLNSSWPGMEVYIALGQPGRLSPDIIPAVQSIANQAALALLNSDVHHELTVQALTDGLTGLANRQGFTEATRRLISTAGDTETAVLFIDLDDFKDVNDTLGHQAGDELLQQVADMLRSVVRGDDVVARLGGDEFAIVLRNTSRATAEQVAERVVLGVSVLSVATGSDLSVGASIGVAMADRTTHLEDLLVHADVAMYSAKAHGKGRIQTYQDPAPGQGGDLSASPERARPPSERSRSGGR